MNKRYLVGVLALCVAGVAAAQEAAQPDPLKVSLDLGATMTDGNSETMKGTAGVNVQGEKAKLGSILGGIQANYGESKVDGEDKTDMDNGKAFVNVKKTLSEKTFLYGDTSALYDNVADVDYRAVAGPGAGLYVLKSEADKLSVEAGPSYVWEKVADDKDEYLAIRIGQRFEHVFGTGSRIWQSLEYLPEAADFNNYLFNAEVGVEAALNSTLSLRLVVQDKYDNQPGPDKEKNDVLFIGGVSIKL